jgi:hypothetical protein
MPEEDDIQEGTAIGYRALAGMILATSALN